MTVNGAIKVAIVEDHVALRNGLELLLGRRGCVIVGTASNASEGYATIRTARPDVAVIDVNLPNETGVSLTKRLLAEDPELGILLYTGAQDSDTLGEAVDCGARGFALKSGAPEALRAAIEAVAGGGTYVDPALRSLLLDRSTTDRVSALSPREREMLHLLAQGRTGEEIAEDLFLSPETVRTHVRNAMNKLEASTRAHAIAIALRDGEIEL